MYCVRIFLVFFLLIFTAAAACSSFFPLMRTNKPGSIEPYTWFMSNSSATGVGRVIWSSWKHTCKTTRRYYLITSILSAVGFGLGLISTLIAAGFTGFRRKKCCYNCFIAVFSFLAFACYCVCFALVLAMFLRDDKCSETVGITRVAYKTQGYKLVEGFGLMVAACGGFLICMLLSLCS